MFIADDGSHHDGHDGPFPPSGDGGGMNSRTSLSGLWRQCCAVLSGTTSIMRMRSFALGLRLAGSNTKTLTMIQRTATMLKMISMID